MPLSVGTPRTSSSKWTICSGEREVAQSLALPMSYNIRLYLHWLSERLSFLIGQNGGGKTLILQASNLPVSDTLFDHSHDIRQKNQWVRGGRYCQCSLHRSFSSVCYRRSNMINKLELELGKIRHRFHPRGSPLSPVMADWLHSDAPARARGTGTGAPHAAGARLWRSGMYREGVL